MKRLTTIGALCAVALLAGILPVAADAGRCTEWSYDCEKTRKTNCRWEIDPFPPYAEVWECDIVTYTGTCYSSSYVSGGTCSERESHSHYTQTVRCDDGSRESATSHRSNSAARRLADAKCPTYSDTVRCDNGTMQTGSASTPVGATAAAYAKCPTYSAEVRCDDGNKRSATSRVSEAAARDAARAKCPTYSATAPCDDGSTESATSTVSESAARTAAQAKCPATAPVLTSMGNRSNNVGDSIDWTLPAATSGTGTITYSLSGYPSGLTFTASNRTLSGTIGSISGSMKTYPYVTYRATNNAGSDTETFDWTVTKPVPSTPETKKCIDDRKAEEVVHGTITKAACVAIANTTLWGLERIGWECYSGSGNTYDFQRSPCDPGHEKGNVIWCEDSQTSMAHSAAECTYIEHKEKPECVYNGEVLAEAGVWTPAECAENSHPVCKNNNPLTKGKRIPEKKCSNYWIIHFCELRTTRHLRNVLRVDCLSAQTRDAAEVARLMREREVEREDDLPADLWNRPTNPITGGICDYTQYPGITFAYAACTKP